VEELDTVDEADGMEGRRENEAREGGTQLDGAGALRCRLGLGADKDEDEAGDAHVEVEVLSVSAMRRFCPRGAVEVAVDEDAAREGEFDTIS